MDADTVAGLADGCRQDACANAQDTTIGMVGGLTPLQNELTCESLAAMEEICANLDPPIDLAEWRTDLGCGES